MVSSRLVQVPNSWLPSGSVRVAVPSPSMVYLTIRPLSPALKDVSSTRKVCRYQSPRKRVSISPANAAKAVSRRMESIRAILFFIVMLLFYGPMIGRAITLKRIQYFHSDGPSVSRTARCIHTPAKEGLSCPGPDTFIPLPPRPERITIDEALISSCMADAKKQLLKRQ